MGRTWSMSHKPTDLGMTYSKAPLWDSTSLLGLIV